MRILVTGGAGYIGSVLVPMLLYEGHTVMVLDNFMYRQTSLLDCAHYKKFQIVRGDVRDHKLLRSCMAAADVLLPLACLTGAPICKERSEEEVRATNLQAIEQILVWRRPDQKIVYPTTNSGYGIGEKDAYCTEESPLHPVSLYGTLKVEAERAILEVGNTITLRFATAFGVSPRMRTDLLVNDFVFRALTDGYIVLYEPRFRRNFIHVRDAARAFLHCIHNFDTMRGNAYNVGLSNANLSKRELCEEIKKQIPAFRISEDAVGEDPDKRNYVVSNAKIELTGFQPKFSLQEGISELIKGYHVVRKNQFSNV